MYWSAPRTGDLSIHYKCGGMIKTNKPETNAECLYSKASSSDFWRLDRERGYVERVHRVPRWESFTPVGVSECPVEFREIGVKRSTIAELASGKKSIHHDIWVGEKAHSRESKMWTGVTRFKLLTVSSSPAKQSAQVTKS